MLARMGTGSAHPGGFAATLALLEHFPVPPGTRVLEVGCGTGRTACHLAKKGALVTAVDIHPKMIGKARVRAASEGARVKFMEADACALPFNEKQFDVVIVESVSIFTDTPKAVSEYRRVLSGGGKLYDREIIARHPLPEEVAKVVKDFFGVDRLWTRDQWVAMLRRAGFVNPTLWQPSRFPTGPQTDNLTHPDYGQVVDFGAAIDTRTIATTSRYDEIMKQYGDQFAYAVLIGTRPGQ